MLSYLLRAWVGYSLLAACYLSIALLAVAGLLVLFAAYLGVHQLVAGRRSPWADRYCRAFEASMRWVEAKVDDVLWRLGF